QTFDQTASRRVVDTAGRPDADERLVEKVFVVPAWCALPVALRSPTARPTSPAIERVSPAAMNLRKHVEPSPDVLAAFGVVRTRGEQAVGRFPPPAKIVLMKRFDRRRRRSRVTADLVGRGEG